MKIIKRSGKEEQFDPVKIQNVLAEASDGIGRPMNKGELNSIAEEVSRGLSGKETATSRDIYESVIKILHEWGYEAVAEAYIKDSGNFWNNEK